MLHEHNMLEKSNYNKDIQRLVAIAPAVKNTVDQVEVKRYSYKSNPYVGAQAASIARRNARERNRVKQVNDGFNALRKRLPASVIAALSGGSRRGSGKKLSKVDTLKMVVEYIRYLQNLIEESNDALGITSQMDIQNYEADEGVYGGNSPYSESVPSPTGSECSSGVSLSYSPNNRYINYQNNQSVTSMEEEDLLDAISWWQHK